MKTRNQLTANKVASAAPATATIVHDNQSASETSNQHRKLDGSHETNETTALNTDGSPVPRLRSNRSSVASDLSRSVHQQQQQNLVNQAAQTVSSDTNSPNLQQGTKRGTTTTTGPTRILPKRSCGRPTSLLAGNQPNHSSAINSNNSNNSTSINTISNNRIVNLSSRRATLGQQVASKKDTHHHHHHHHHHQQQVPQFTSTPLPLDPNLDHRPDSSLSNTSNPTANIIKNYSKDDPLTRSAVPYRQQSANNQHDRDQTITTTTATTNDNRGNKTNKPVCISLPANISCPRVNAAGLSSNIVDEIDGHDSDRYMFTINGLKKIGTTTDAELAEVAARRDANLSSDNNYDQFQADDTNVHDAIPINLVYSKKNFNLLLAVTGSVATIKLVELAKQIRSMFPRPYKTPKNNGATVEATIKIKIIMTHSSKHFQPKEDLIKSLNDSSVDVYDDADEWSNWKRMGDPVLHIELRKWADLCLIAPLDANTLAKMANGICDNLLTCVVRAWDITKPLVYCPAMNVHMYNHPLTREHLSKLQSFGYFRVDSVEKRLACGDIGIGGMASVETISNKVLNCLMQPTGRKVSLSRPLLNQQPTYPIVSMSDDQVGCNAQQQTRLPSSISNQILNRFRANNQISVHAIPNSTLKANLSPSSLPYNEDSLTTKRQTKTTDLSGPSDFHFLMNESVPPVLHYRPPILSGTGNNNNGKQQKMGGVTSVQNLKAIGVANGSLDCSLAEHANVADDESLLEFEPSKFLEQSMTTDESVSIELVEPNKATAQSLLVNPTTLNFGPNSLPFSDRGGLGSGSGLASGLNTSKFLSLCQDKERGCFTCTICKHDYKNRKSMARHLKEQHVQGNIYQCRPCGVSYKRREKLIKHNRERHPGIL